MHNVSLNEVLENSKQFSGCINKIYIHWTAGTYNQVFGDYHFCIQGDGTIIQTTNNLSERLAHTWRRNSNAIGIALCCAYDAMIWADGRFDLGSMPPTQAQIETCAKLVDFLCESLNIDISIDNIMTHSEIADIDGYGPAYIGTSKFEKWDLWKLQDFDNQWKSGGDVIRGKALWYRANR